MKILVTGTAGYVGQHVAETLIKQGHQVEGLDIKFDPQQDLVNWPEVEQMYFEPDEQIDIIVHLAAVPRVQKSVEFPAEVIKDNVNTTSYLLDFARRKKVKRFIFASSCAVYGSSDGKGPTSPYGLHKLMSELECDLYSRLYGLDTVCLRFFNIYSKDQPTDGPYSMLISAWVEALENNNKLKIFGDGENIREWIHVKDVCDAISFVMNYNKPFNGDCYDISSGQPLCVNQIKEWIQKHDKYNKVEFIYEEARAGDARYVTSNIQPMRDLGWQAKILYNEGFKECFLDLLEVK